MPISFDFNSIKSRILTNLSAKSEWSEFLSYGVIDNLIDVMAQEMAYEIQYKEYLTMENWWTKARNKSSLLTEAPVHGYIVPRKKGAFGTLRVSTSETFNASYASDIQIPKYFQFSNGSTFLVATQTYTLTGSTNYVDLLAKQGEAKNITFYANGDLFETKVIVDDSVDNDFFELYVNDLPYTNVESIYAYTADELVYQIIQDPSFSYITLKFGNGVFGKKLVNNDKVVFRYISTKGSTGNILTTNNVTTVEDQAYDINGIAIPLYVTNTTAVTGGYDYPSLEEIRNLSPRTFQTGDRATSVTDYETIITGYNFVSKVSVWGAYEYLNDLNLDPWTYINTEDNVVHIAALNAAYSNLTYDEKNEIVDRIHTINDPTDILRFETIEQIDLFFYSSIVVKNTSYVTSDVIARVNQTLVDNYGIQNISFNENLYFSEYTGLIDTVEGVRNNNTYVKVRKDLLFTGQYLVNFQVPLFPLTGTTIEVYIKLLTDTTYTLIGTGNLAGVITGEVGYNLTGSQINLINGLGILVVNAGLSQVYTNYNIRILYRPTSNDLELKSRNQIFAYQGGSFTATYPI
jgi:hypothetical protein